MNWDRRAGQRYDDIYVASQTVKIFLKALSVWSTLKAHSHMRWKLYCLLQVAVRACITRRGRHLLEVCWRTFGPLQTILELLWRASVSVTLLKCFSENYIDCSGYIIQAGNLAYWREWPTSLRYADYINLPLWLISSDFLVSNRFLQRLVPFLGTHWHTIEPYNRKRSTFPLWTSEQDWN